MNPESRRAPERSRADRTGLQKHGSDGPLARENLRPRQGLQRGAVFSIDPSSQNPPSLSSFYKYYYKNLHQAYWMDSDGKREEEAELKYSLLWSLGILIDTNH